MRTTSLIALAASTICSSRAASSPLSSLDSSSTQPQALLATSLSHTEVDHSPAQHLILKRDRSWEECTKCIDKADWSAVKSWPDGGVIQVCDCPKPWPTKIEWQEILEMMASHPNGPPMDQSAPMPAIASPPVATHKPALVPRSDQSSDHSDVTKFLKRSFWRGKCGIPTAWGFGQCETEPKIRSDEPPLKATPPSSTKTGSIQKRNLRDYSEAGLIKSCRECLVARRKKSSPYNAEVLKDCYCLWPFHLEKHRQCFKCLQSVKNHSDRDFCRCPNTLMINDHDARQLWEATPGPVPTYTSTINMSNKRTRKCIKCLKKHRDRGEPFDTNLFQKCHKCINNRAVANNQKFGGPIITVNDAVALWDNKKPSTAEPEKRDMQKRRNAWRRHKCKKCLRKHRDNGEPWNPNLMVICHKCKHHPGLTVDEIAGKVITLEAAAAIWDEPRGDLVSTVLEKRDPHASVLVKRHRRKKCIVCLLQHRDAGEPWSVELLKTCHKCKHKPAIMTDEQGGKIITDEEAASLWEGPRSLDSAAREKRDPQAHAFISVTKAATPAHESPSPLPGSTEAQVERQQKRSVDILFDEEAEVYRCRHCLKMHRDNGEPWSPNLLVTCRRCRKKVDNLVSWGHKSRLSETVAKALWMVPKHDIETAMAAQQTLLEQQWKNPTCGAIKMSRKRISKCRKCLIRHREAGHPFLPSLMTRSYCTKCVKNGCWTINELAARSLWDTPQRPWEKRAESKTAAEPTSTTPGDESLLGSTESANATLIPVEQLVKRKSPDRWNEKCAQRTVPNRVVKCKKCLVAHRDDGEPFVPELMSMENCRRCAIKDCTCKAWHHCPKLWIISEEDALALWDANRESKVDVRPGVERRTTDWHEARDFTLDRSSTTNGTFNTSITNGTFSASAVGEQATFHTIEKRRHKKHRKQKHPPPEPDPVCFDPSVDPIWPKVTDSDSSEKCKSCLEKFHHIKEPFSTDLLYHCRPLCSTVNEIKYWRCLQDWKVPKGMLNEAANVKCLIAGGFQSRITETDARAVYRQKACSPRAVVARSVPVEAKPMASIIAPRPATGPVTIFSTSGAGTTAATVASASATITSSPSAESIGDSPAIALDTPKFTMPDIPPTPIMFIGTPSDLPEHGPVHSKRAAPPKNQDETDPARDDKCLKCLRKMPADTQEVSAEQLKNCGCHRNEKRTVSEEAADGEEQKTLEKRKSREEKERKKAAKKEKKRKKKEEKKRKKEAKKRKKAQEKKKKAAAKAERKAEKKARKEDEKETDKGKDENEDLGVSHEEVEKELKRQREEDIKEDQGGKSGGD